MLKSTFNVKHIKQKLSSFETIKFQFGKSINGNEEM